MPKEAEAREEVCAVGSSEQGDVLRTLVVHEDTCVRVTLVGELATDTVAQLGEVRSRLNSGTKGEVVLDLSELRFLDLAGARALVEVQRMVEEAGGHLTVLGLGHQPRMLARLTGLERFLDLGQGY